MSLDPATIRRIATLARIHVEDAELATLQAELNGILGWIEQLERGERRWRRAADRRGADGAEDARGRGDRRRLSATRCWPTRRSGPADFFAVPKVVE